MDIIQRNFFRLLRSGVLNEYESLEPMSTFKWNRLFQIVKVQGVEDIALKGIKNHTYDENAGRGNRRYPHHPSANVQFRIKEKAQENTN